MAPRELGEGERERHAEQPDERPGEQRAGARLRGARPGEDQDTGTEHGPEVERHRAWKCDRADERHCGPSLRDDRASVPADLSRLLFGNADAKPTPPATADGTLAEGDDR